jgi:uncharacterized repeat protein (TIGR03803 family)
MAMSTLREYRSLVSQFSLTLRSAALALAIITLVLGIFATQSARAQTFTTLASFDQADGAGPGPSMSMIQGLDGTFYGTTQEVGTVFNITSGGILTVVTKVVSEPYGGVVQTTDGNFYGTTHTAGKYNKGTVFEVTPNGVLTTLHSFGGSSGWYPAAGLVQATNGSFYGTTYTRGPDGGGTVFKITPSGNLKVLYSFCSQTDCTDGNGASAALIQATNGTLYGTTSEGGANNHGTVFKITPSGTFTSLYSFCSTTRCADGGEPLAGLVQAANGNLYGTTSSGGVHNGGTVFEITPSGNLTTLYSLCALSNCTDGRSPQAGLIQATDGNFYGTTAAGGISCSPFGSAGCGTIFRITSTGKLTTLYSFCAQTNCPDGAEPAPGLFQSTNGIIYGATQVGGADGDGVVFSLSIGLGPFVEALPYAAKAGTSINVLGQGLTGTTAVSFNGVAAKFYFISDSRILATVPKRATTGFLTVTTPGGKLKSNKKFLILK